MADDPCQPSQDQLNRLWNDYSAASTALTDADSALDAAKNAVQGDQDRLNNAQASVDYLGGKQQRYD
jgi:hypothetical protein